MQRFLYLVALFSIPLVEATEVKRASTAAPDTTLKTLRRRQASGDTSSLAGALTLVTGSY